MRRILVFLGAAFVIACCSCPGGVASPAEAAAFLVAQAGAPPASDPAVAPTESTPEEDSKATAEGAGGPPEGGSQSKCEGLSGFWLFVCQGWPLLLLLPGAAGLGVAAVKEHCERKRKCAQVRASGTQQQPSPSEDGLDNRFLVAAVAATIWLVTLAFMIPLVEPNEAGVPFYKLFHEEFGFYLFVPVLGYIGALLYVLDLSRRGSEDIPKGTEFGMRLVMGPYVAIVMVWFAEDIDFFKAESPLAQGILAFVSGLLVVIALQGLVEKGQEVLGRWRDKARYAPSKIAKQFNLTKEQDLELREAGIQDLLQLAARTEDSLKADAKRFGLDEDFLLEMRKDAQEERKKKQIKERVGPLAWGVLQTTANVKEVADFAKLSDKALDDAVSKNQKIRLNGLKKLRDAADALCTPQPAP
jgi:hypothetical protein